MDERWSNDGQTMEKEWSCKPVICDGISMDNWKMTFLRQYLELSDILIIFATCNLVVVLNILRNNYEECFWKSVFPSVCTPLSWNHYGIEVDRLAIRFAICLF